MALHDGALLLGTILGFCHICFILNRNTWYFFKKKKKRENIYLQQWAYTDIAMMFFSEQGIVTFPLLI